MPHPLSWIRRLSVTFTGLLTLAVALVAAAPSIGQNEAANFAAYVQRYGGGEIDWEAGIIYGRAIAYLEDQKGNRAMAQRAAQVMAAANIVRLAAGIRLDDRRLLGDLGSGQVVIRLRAFLNVVNHSSRFVEDGGKPYYEVVRKTPITGIKGLTRQLLTQFGDSVSEGLRWPDTPAPPSGETLSDDQAPWLVLDARHLAAAGQVQPALFPAIRAADGRILYDWRTVAPDALESRGMARYVVSDVDASRWQSGTGTPSDLLALLSPAQALAEEETLPRATGRRRYIVKKVEGAEGLARTNLVVSNADAEALASEDVASRILKKCRVIVIVNSPIGGVEGALDSKLRRSS
ncbi:MAG: hypothetical protein ABIL58_04445 [Pseudomonadota bacterium]